MWKLSEDLSILALYYNRVFCTELNLASNGQVHPSLRCLLYQISKHRFVLVDKYIICILLMNYHFSINLPWSCMCKDICMHIGVDRQYLHFVWARHTFCTDTRWPWEALNHICVHRLFIIYSVEHCSLRSIKVRGQEDLRLVSILWFDFCEEHGECDEYTGEDYL